jgi:hypothetical protein
MDICSLQRTQTAMDALEYEYLIRRIYQTGRTSANGADADVYRKMERAETALRLDSENCVNHRMRISTKSIEELQQGYESECIRVWQFIQKAIRKFLQERSAILDADELQDLQNYSEKRDLPLKREIDSIISVANEILADKQIFPR